MIEVMKRIVLIFWIILLTGVVRPAVSQQVKADAILDTNSILIGDQIGFHLGLTIPVDYHFVWPVLDDTLTANVEIVKKSPVDTLSIDHGVLTLGQQFTITSFDSGYYVIPPVKFRFGPAGDSLTGEVETEPYLLNVFSVAVDTTKSIKPIKMPEEAPYTFAEIFPWALLGIVIILLVAFVVYYLRRRAENKPVFSRPKPKLPPHRIALDALEKLKNEKVWQQNREKEYHSRLTDIIRVYIEDRFGIKAVEMTTPEILESAGRHAEISSGDMELLKDMLELADLVKFAKFKPMPSENEQVMDKAFAFVKNTMQVSKAPDEMQNGEKKQVETKKNETET